MNEDLHEEFTLAWDGEISMSGQPHRASMGSFPSFEAAQTAANRLPSAHTKPNLRIERRLVTTWSIA